MILLCAVLVQEDVPRLKDAVEALTAPAMAGRRAGSDGARAARSWLVDRFKERGLKVDIEEFRYGETTCANVVGRLDHGAGRAVVLGAHYDHLGFGGPKSRSLVRDRIHPGADDNASGVAVLLLLAERLKKSGSPKFDYVFLGFSGHEDGLHGSADAAGRFDPAKVRLMVNLDMVGRLHRGTPVVRVTRRKEDEGVDPLLGKPPFRLRVVEDGWKDTDAGAFAQRGITALSLTTGPHEDYHKTSDSPETLNYEGMLAVLDWIEGFLAAVANER